MTILRLHATEPPPYGTRAQSGHSLHIWLEAQLPVVVVEMLGRVVVRICQGHEVLEVGITAGREVRPPAQAGLVLAVHVPLDLGCGRVQPSEHALGGERATTSDGTQVVDEVE